MQYKSLSVLLLAATAVADLVDNLATQTNLADLTSGITVPTLDIPTPPPSIVSVLVTAVPDSFYSTLENDASRSAFYHSIQEGDYPQWYKDLPGSVKSWLSTAYATATAGIATNAHATTTGGSSSPTGSASAGAAGSSTSKGLAAPTGAVAMGLMGAAGVLGLAIAL